MRGGAASLMSSRRFVTAQAFLSFAGGTGLAKPPEKDTAAGGREKYLDFYRNPVPPFQGRGCSAGTRRSSCRGTEVKKARMEPPPVAARAGPPGGRNSRARSSRSSHDLELDYEETFRDELQDYLRIARLIHETMSGQM